MIGLVASRGQRAPSRWLATGAAATSSQGTIQACGLMPDTKTSVRWEQFDKPYLLKAFKAAGVNARVVNAQGDAQTMKTQADQCIADGAKVLHHRSDRLRLGRRDREGGAQGRASSRSTTTARSRVASPSCTRRSTGRPSACCRARESSPASRRTGRTATNPVVASLWGGAEDANSFLFKSGVDQVLNPLYKNGTLSKGPQQLVPGWDNQKAGTIFQQMLVRTSNNIQGVAAANDGLAERRGRGPEGRASWIRSR